MPVMCESLASFWNDWLHMRVLVVVDQPHLDAEISTQTSIWEPLYRLGSCGANADCIAVIEVFEILLFRISGNHLLLSPKIDLLEDQQQLMYVDLCSHEYHFAPVSFSASPFRMLQSRLHVAIHSHPSPCGVHRYNYMAQILLYHQ